MAAQLQDFKHEFGPRWGALSYWCATGAQQRALDACNALSPTAGHDAFDSAVETLQSSDAPSVIDVLASDDPERITSWVITTARQRLSENSRADGKRIKRAQVEASFADITESGAVLENDDDPADRAVIVERARMIREALVALKDRPLQSAVLERIWHGAYYEDLAKKYFRGVSRQAATKRIKNAEQRVALYMRGLGAGEGCGEIATFMTEASWRIDSLGENVRDQVTAHLSHCQTCRHELIVQRRAVAAAGAFMPIPILDPGIFGTAAANLRGLWDSLLGRAGEGGGAVLASSGSWQGVRPAAGIAAVALLLGGGGYAAHQATTDQPQAATKQVIVSPPSLFDPIDPPAEKKAPKRKRRPKRRPAPRATTPPSTPTPRTPDTPAARADDGSTEFLPEAR